MEQLPYKTGGSPSKKTAFEEGPLGPDLFGGKQVCLGPKEGLCVLPRLHAFQLHSPRLAVVMASPAWSRASGFLGIQLHFQLSDMAG